MNLKLDLRQFTENIYIFNFCRNNFAEIAQIIGQMLWSALPSGASWRLHGPNKLGLFQALNLMLELVWACFLLEPETF